MTTQRYTASPSSPDPAGGRSKRPPGLRTEYRAEYYGAYVWDPDGNNIEAVHHGSRQQVDEQVRVAGPDSGFP